MLYSRYPPYSTFAFNIFRFAATIPIVQPAITGESIRSALLWSISVGVSTVAVLSYMGKLNWMRIVLYDDDDDDDDDDEYDDEYDDDNNCCWITNFMKTPVV
jgi:hypothetical protein